VSFSLPRVSGQVPLGVAILVAIVATGVLALPRLTLAGPDVHDGWRAGTFSADAERELIDETDVSRGADGDPPLAVDPALTAVARWRSRDMVERGYFSHDIPDVGSVFHTLDTNGYCYTVAGENIGWDIDADGEAPAAIYAMFLASPGHRRNILDGRWEAIGVGAFKAADGRKMWTVLFADRCG